MNMKFQITGRDERLGVFLSTEEMAGSIGGRQWTHLMIRQAEADSAGEISSGYSEASFVLDDENRHALIDALLSIPDRVED